MDVCAPAMCPGHSGDPILGHSAIIGAPIANVRPWHPKEVERFERTEILRVAFALQNLEISGQLFCRLGPCLHPTVLGARDACPSGLP